ncbi:GNAT family N-acetyltransferase [Nocardia sp. BMG111209]|uniref:GNAT family N-acetyltransferase n=1 Tax=Nocardia sp. BMG111209 TaxID=1160137 RepID=UPI00035DA939|nr:GNAT family protein [Nocardia sp. BMG111209]
MSDRILLGPVPLHGSAVRIRSPRPADHAAWQAARLRDRKLIEPYWHSSELDWADRHTERQWIHEYVAGGAEVRAGRQLSGVIEVDGRFAGQCELCRLDTRNGVAELSIWIDSRYARHGFSCVATALVLDHAFGSLGLERILAPIAPDNTVAIAFAQRLGFVREALLARYFDAGGARTDHDLWTLIRADLPAEGLVRSQLRRMEDGRSAGSPVPLPTEDAAPHGSRLGTAALVGVLTARHTAWRIRRTLSLLSGDRSVRLSVPGYPGIVLRNRTFADGARRAAALAHGDPVTHRDPYMPGDPLTHGDPLTSSDPNVPGDPLTHGDLPTAGGLHLPGDPLTHGDPLTSDDLPGPGDRPVSSDSYMPGDPMTHGDSPASGDPHGSGGDPAAHNDSHGSGDQGGQLAEGGRASWWREFAGSRGGLRSDGGLVLVLEADGAYAGEYRVFDLDMFDRNARLSGWVDPGRVDAGVRTAALRAVLDHAVDSLGLYRVAIEIDAADTGSAAVAAGAGMLAEGLLRNHRGSGGQRAVHTLWALTVAEPERERV